MLRNYLKIAWRNIRNNKGYTLLNITGLAIAFGVFITALRYVDYETGYDKWDASLSRVYRVGISKTKDGETEANPWSAYPLGTQIMNSCPEAEAVTRIVNIDDERVVSQGEKSFYENKMIAADSSFFDVFPYTFKEGSRLTALNKPGQAVITTEFSRKMFGDVSPIGKTIDIASGYRPKKTYLIAGVIQKTGPSHLDFNICISQFNSSPENWGRQFYITYFRIKPNTVLASLSSKASNIYISNEAIYQFTQKQNNEPQTVAPGNNPAEWLMNNQHTTTRVFFEPVSGIHLKPQATLWRKGDSSSHYVMDSNVGNNMPVIFFSIAASLVLLLACINFTNLAVARAGKRAKETGMRKVMGAVRLQLIFQFLAEAFLQCLAALFIGLVLANFMVGLINNAFGLHLSFVNERGPIDTVYLIGRLLLIVVLVSLLSGAYPAFVLSSFVTAKVIKGEITKNIKGKLLRNSLVVIQFSISTFFIIGLLVVYFQLQYMRTNDPGFSADQVLVLHPANNSIINPEDASQKISVIKNQLMHMPGVEEVTLADAYPGTASINIQEATYNGNDSKMNFNYIHFNYFEVLNMKIVAGRNFSSQYASDSINSAVINETAARKMGFKNPIGQKVTILLRDYTIIGVIKDSYVAGYETHIAPAIYAIGIAPHLFDGYKSLLVKLNGHNAAGTTQAIQAYWKTLEPAFPLRYSWMDQNFANLIAKYERFGKITTILAIISTIIALMGIFALSAFSAEQRTKEIGIRKVFGASVSDISAMLSKDFIRLVVLALFIAIPLGYWGTNKWLENFAYRIPLSWQLFFVTGIIVLSIALLTVSFQAIKAALANPVKSLRTE